MVHRLSGAHSISIGSPLVCRSVASAVAVTVVATTAAVETGLNSALATPAEVAATPPRIADFFRVVHPTNKNISISP